jgi:CBS domain-containing protein
MTATAAHKPDALSIETALVEDVMHPGVFTCSFDTPLEEVARMLASHRVHCVVGLGEATVGEPRAWGLVTDRDIVAAAATDHERGTAGHSAATPTVTVGPHEHVRRAAELMTEHGVMHLLVVQPGTERPLGVISALDIAAALGGLAARVPTRGGTRVDELMSTPVATVSAETSLKDVATMLVERGISAVPVVSDGEVLGVVSEADIVAEEQGPQRKGSLARLLRSEDTDLAPRLGARTAGEAMSAPAVTIEWWQPAAAAATLMTARAVKRLPVLRNGKLIGIVSRSDLVRAYARPDSEIERELRDRVLFRVFWLEPGRVAVTVSGGEVTLEGIVDTEADVEALPRLARRVPGVVSVRSSLTVSNAR